mgnify:CR=1 FL=1
MHTLLLSLAALTLASSSAVAAEPTATGTARAPASGAAISAPAMPRDARAMIAEIATRWVGDFDNHRQVAASVDRGAPASPETTRERREMKVLRLDAPQLGVDRQPHARNPPATGLEVAQQRCHVGGAAHTLVGALGVRDKAVIAVGRARIDPMAPSGVPGLRLDGLELDGA